GGRGGAKPVGTVFICRASRGSGGAIDAEARRFQISGDREAVRDRSAKIALAMLRFHLAGLPTPRLIWEVE
ncbi:MAG TPA: hypothetical protein DEB06_11840, partial [Phycisphaerales bacterium]|nr:hypothetical protein [Phycisphaerales bacterium]